jgi:energy-coupling factor transporter transmembrane protein EcfT
MRWTIFSGIGFAMTVTAVSPFLAGFPLHDYWNSAGKYLLLLCMGFFVVFIFEAGFTYVLWSRKRAFDKIEREQQLHRHG